MKRTDDKGANLPYGQHYEVNKMVEKNPEDETGGMAEVELDRIYIDKHKNEITLMYAHNMKEPRSSTKVNPAGIQMSLFQSEGRTPQDLNKFRVANVAEKETRNPKTVDVIDELRETHADFKSINADTGRREFIFRANSNNARERDAFDKLMQSNYGVNADRMNYEFGMNKLVDRITVYKPRYTDVTDFWVDFDYKRV